MLNAKKFYLFLPVLFVLFLTACTSVPDFDSMQTRTVFTRAIERATPHGYIGESRVLAYRTSCANLPSTEPQYCVVTFPQDPAVTMLLQYVNGSVPRLEYRLMKDGTLWVLTSSEKEDQEVKGTAAELSSVKFLAAFLSGGPAADIAEKVVRKENNVLLLTRTGEPANIVLTVNKVSNLPEKLEYPDDGDVVQLQQVMVKNGILTPGKVLNRSAGFQEEMVLLNDAETEKLVAGIQKNKLNQIKNKTNK